MNSMLEYKGYHASVEYDADDDIFIGEAFGIADSLNFHGASARELKKMFEQSIDNYLDLCQKIGKNPDKEFRGTEKRLIYIIIVRDGFDKIRNAYWKRRLCA